MSMLEHWQEVQESHDCIMEFIGFLEEKYSLCLDFEYAEKGTPLDIRSLVNEFLGVDGTELERERRKLLDSLTNS